jgi:hypothetical protein
MYVFPQASVRAIELLSQYPCPLATAPRSYTSH